MFSLWIPKRVPARVRSRRRSLLRQDPGKCQNRRHNSRGFLGPDRLHTLRARWLFRVRRVRLGVHAQECSRFITPGLETDVYQTIERLINTIGSPQIAIDERHTPKLYERFLASLLAKHRRDGTAHGRMHQQGPPAQQPQTGSGAPVYQQPPQQQPPTSHGQSPTYSAGVDSASRHDLPPSVSLNNGATAPEELADVVLANAHEPSYMVGAPPDFEFGNEEQHEPMNFTFDTIFTPGNDDMLAAMQAILNPAWSQTMMMPGFSWPSGESMQGHNNFLGNGMAMNNYQNVQPQPEVLLG